MSSNRRDFIKHSAALAGAGLASTLPLSAMEPRKKPAPSDQINLAVIGAKGMGWSNMRSHLKMSEVNCAAFADVDQNVLDQRVKDVTDLRGKAPKAYGDYRKLLENKDIDAVVIGSPDHWHCLMMVDAVSAGKHVYVEKPLANTIQECQIMQAAAKRYGKVVQVGQWQRSGGHYEKAIEYVRSGKLGQIRLVKVWAYQGWMKPVPVQPDGSAPSGVNYDLWLGPAPKRPFNPNRFHFTFRWFWDYAGGLMTDWGVHEIDIALYAMNASAPKSVVASGGKFAYPDDASETPDTLQAVFEYENFNMLWEHATGIDGGNYGKSEGIAFIGNNGTLVVNRGGWEIIPEIYSDDGLRKYKLEAIPYQGRQDDYLDLHTRNFIDAVRKNDPSLLKCGVDTGSVAAINAQMGNIAYRTGRKVYWDSAASAFKNDRQANDLMQATYYNGYRVPKV